MPGWKKKSVQTDKLQFNKSKFGGKDDSETFISFNDAILSMMLFNLPVIGLRQHIFPDSTFQSFISLISPRQKSRPCGIRIWIVVRHLVHAAGIACAKAKDLRASARADSRAQNAKLTSTSANQIRAGPSLKFGNSTLKAAILRLFRS